MSKWLILTDKLSVSEHLVSVKVVGKATFPKFSYSIHKHFVGECHEFLGKSVSISTSGILLVSQFDEMWQEAEKSPVIPLMTAKDAVWDTYIIVFFPTNVVLSMSNSKIKDYVHYPLV